MKSDLDFLKFGKWMNAAGTAGYAPGKGFKNKFPDIDLFITNPVSFLPRKPADDRNILFFDGGFLVHSGHPNPGIKRIINLYQKYWENSDLPICINLLSDQPAHLERIIRSVEEIENIVAIELSINYPLTKYEILDMVQSIMGELPIILNISDEFVYQDWIDQLLIPEIFAISLQAPRGIINYDGQYISGRLFGRSILPKTLQMIKHLASLGKPIFAGVGIVDSKDIIKLFELGASNFQAHELIWRNNI